MTEPTVEPPPVNETEEIVYITPDAMTKALDHKLSLIAVILYALVIAIMT